MTSGEPAGSSPSNSLTKWEVEEIINSPLWPVLLLLEDWPIVRSQNVRNVKSMRGTRSHTKNNRHEFVGNRDIFAKHISDVSQWLLVFATEVDWGTRTVNTAAANEVIVRKSLRMRKALLFKPFKGWSYLLDLSTIL